MRNREERRILLPYRSADTIIDEAVRCNFFYFVFARMECSYTPCISDAFACKYVIPNLMF